MPSEASRKGCFANQPQTRSCPVARSHNVYKLPASSTTLLVVSFRYLQHDTLLKTSSKAQLTANHTKMSTQALYSSLLRPPILHILRAAGFHATRPAVLDTLVDLTARYIMLLGSATASNAISNHNDACPDITDLRMALQQVGAFVPQMDAMEEQWNGEEDMRGLEAFLEWVKGDANKEIRRVAGLAPTEGEVVDAELLGQREDFLTGTLFHSIGRVGSYALVALKKKHSKTGEESRYQGTALGIQAEEKVVRIEGGHVESIQAWEARLRGARKPRRASSSELLSIESIPEGSVSVEEV